MLVPTADFFTLAAETATPDRGDGWLMVAAVSVIAAYLFWLWWGDLKVARAGNPNPHAFPGAVPAPTRAVVIAVVGAVLLLFLETAGEYVLGISDEQHSIAAVFLLSMIAAAFVEELIFRGYLVVTKKGRAALVLSIVGFSLLFAVLHPFLWNWDVAEDDSWWQGTLVLDFSLKAWFSTSMMVFASLWFYAVRFLPVNPAHSLIPCVAAHLTKNVGVFIIKWAQGFVVW